MIGQYESPFGWIEYEKIKGSLTRVSWMNTVPAHPIFDSELQSFWSLWFQEPTVSCPFPMLLKGTPFQLAVWAQLQKIPLGHTQTYKEIAIAVGSPKAQQAVGQACKVNPIMLLIPCHRVLGQNDKLTGYVGTQFLSTKQRLLEWEHRMITLPLECKVNPT